MRADPLAQGVTALTPTRRSIPRRDPRLAQGSGNWIIVDSDATNVFGVVEEAHPFSGLANEAVTYAPFNRWDPGLIELIGGGSIVGLANPSVMFYTVDRTPSAKVANLVPSQGVFTLLYPVAGVRPGDAGVITLDDWATLYNPGSGIALPPGFSLLGPYDVPTVPRRERPSLAADFSSITQRLGTLEVLLPTLTDMSSEVGANIGKSLRAIESSLAQLQSPAISAMASDVSDTVSRSLQAIEASLSQLMSAAPMAKAVSHPAPSPTPSSASVNRAVQAVEDLQEWLDLTVDQAAELTGSSKSAIHYWKRENALPRPGTARHLFKVHALVRALKAATEPDPPLSILTATPVHGGPSAYELLQSGNYEQAETLVRNLLFGEGRLPTDPRTPDLIGDSIPAPKGMGLGLKTPVKRARSVKLTRK